MAKRFERYELVREIGRGGQAVVYEAYDPRLGRAVALKVLLPGSRSEDGIRRFEREARSAARLKHPNIVSIYEVGEEHGRHYVAMEMVRGGTLADGLAAGPPPPREGVRLVERLARAAHYAHGQGVIHRDVKPGNILMDERGALHFS